MQMKRHSASSSSTEGFSDPETPTTVVGRYEFLSKEKRERYLTAAYYADYVREISQCGNELRGQADRIHYRDKSGGIDAAQLFSALQLSHKALRFEHSKIHMWGVRTDEPIQAGEPIVEYIGERVRGKIVELREREYEREGNNGSYVFRSSPDVFIDATHVGGLARYVNHGCEPNCETKIIPYQGTSRVVIFAKRDIDPCEELCYDYKLPYECKEKAIVCLCGALHCKGWLNYIERNEPVETAAENHFIGEASTENRSVDEAVIENVAGEVSSDNGSGEKKSDGEIGDSNQISTEKKRKRKVEDKKTKEERFAAIRKARA
jgi:hypothetical protein